MNLSMRYKLLVALFIAGGLVIGYMAAIGKEKIALIGPAWMILIFILMLWLVRCSRCGTPAMVVRVRLFGRTVWVITPGVNERCDVCGNELH